MLTTILLILLALGFSQIEFVQAEESLQRPGTIEYGRPKNEYISDEFEYTLTDGEFTSLAKVNVFFDCACSVRCFANEHLYTTDLETNELQLLYSRFLS